MVGLGVRGWQGVVHQSGEVPPHTWAPMGNPIAIEWLNLLLNQSGIHLSMHRKASLLTPGCGEGKRNFCYRRPSKEFRTASAENTQLPSGFQPSIF